MRENIQKTTFIIALLWTIVVAASVAWNIHTEKDQTIARAEAVARLAFNKDMEFRKWATIHGGVYVPITDETQPNPYLDVPEKYAVTDKDKRLTLMNPAYMMRQIYERMEKEGSVRGHISSLKPLRPKNSPDPWEKEALIRFETGEKEIFAIQTLNGTEWARFMSPFVTVKGCLKCHEKQGYKEGDIRGGVSVSVPMATLRIFEKQHIHTMFMGHLLLWISGLVVIIFLGNYALKNRRRQIEAEEAGRIAQERMTKAFQNSPEWITITTVSDGRYMEVNEAFEKATGYSREETLGKTSVELGLWLNHDKRSRFVSKFQKEGSLKNEEIVLRLKSGESVTLLWSAERIMVKGEECMLNVVRDISEKKKTEEALKKSEERMRAFITYSVEGIWCFELKKPVPVELPDSEQIQLFYEHGALIECNNSMAVMHGYANPEDIIGASFGSLIPRLSKQNLEYLKAFIHSGYILSGRESKEIDATGNIRFFLNSLIGIVEKNYLVRIWGVQQDISEQKKLEEQLQTLAITDTLTGLLNRRGFITLSEQQLKATQRTGRGLLLSFIDLDDMKTINDKWGHEEGDISLISAANILKDTFRESDIIARVGGDEFAVLAVNTTGDNPEILISRLQYSINAFNEKAGRPYKIAMSIGTSVYEPENPRSLDELMAEADMLMYEQKQKKKGVL